MIQVSQQMLFALKQARRQVDDEALLRYAYQRFPTLVRSLSSQELGARLERARAIATPLSLDEADAALILDVIFMFGIDFDRQPWADVLSLPGLSGRERLDILRNRCAPGR